MSLGSEGRGVRLFDIKAFPPRSRTARLEKSTIGAPSGRQWTRVVRFRILIALATLALVAVGG
jgi:hypothetical protein